MTTTFIGILLLVERGVICMAFPKCMVVFDLNKYAVIPGLEVIKLEYSLKLKIKRNDWLLADVSASSQSLRFILSLRMNSSFITSGPD